MFVSRSSYIEHLKRERTSFKPIGKFVASFTRNLMPQTVLPIFLNVPTRLTPKRLVKLKPVLQASETKTFKMYKVNATNPTFMPLNDHLQALLQFYIECASFIPVDEIWNYFLVYLDNKLIAYATTFEEYLKVPKAAVTIS
jgi:hypothetical protein